ncbi:aromatic-ring-hydroxylating dioxygenase subunit alpha [Actinomadura sp. NBRC 104412]|uniref:aromatic ring-hydroxylating oxygenase subunit alpha n=1 Tax=Actinomadura sp. NBRC 104412 TaxID=3032203 RepID=UPI0024A07504|nr:aromatic ring-hydroxylating dioxygenase subunit alpha [Actinomadura sp. NBRC 104412]GLZ08140.1 aromatic-ring-hydroxylating dioxygenase subunit alpha [Actinomadura sp. NBRC 104412]
MTVRLPETQRIPPRRTRYIRDERDPNAFLVQRSVFVDDAVLAREREAIFNRCWIYVGHESEIPNPNDFVARTVAGRPVLFTRDKEGHVHVLYNACTHRGAEVCRERRGNTRRFRCFYHSWSFSTDGRLVAMPDEEGYPEGFDREAHRLRGPARVESYRGFCFMNVHADAEPLDEYLAGAKYYLDLTADQSATGMVVTPGAHEYSIKANWKLLVENSFDGYHAIPVHKTYLDVQRARGDEIAGNTSTDWKQSHAYDLGNGHAVTVKEAPWGRPIARWKPSMGADTKPIIEESYRRLVEVHGEERAAEIANLDFNMHIFPNLVVNNIMAVIIRTFYPLTPGLLHVNAWSLAPPEESPAARRVRNESFLSFLGPAGLATPDDNEALESCHRGYASDPGEGWSDVSRGMDFPEPRNWDELQMRTFWRRWSDLVEGMVEY